MSSPKREEVVPDLQLSFVFGNSVVTPQTPHIPPEAAEPQELHEHYPTEMLCLRRTELTNVGESILKISTLKYLNLEGNQISSVPDSLFIRLPNLLWLDLRNNQIASLPAEIGLHRSLKTLLLEANPIAELPPELGNVITLNGLNLRYCPIIFPPQDIVAQGLQRILQYLRSAMAKHPVSLGKTSPELPMVEKLQLSELMESSVEEDQDGSVDEDELQRFRELKDKMILLDKAELESIGRGDRNLKADARTVTKTSQEALWNRQTQAKTTQVKTLSEHKREEHERQRKREDAETDSKPGVEDSSDTPQTRIPGMSITQYKEDRSVLELERQIHAHIEKMEEKHRNPRGTAAQQMEAAEHDVKMLRMLQARVLERKKKRGRNLENRFI